MFHRFSMSTKDIGLASLPITVRQVISNQDHTPFKNQKNMLTERGILIFHVLYYQQTLLWAIFIYELDRKPIILMDFHLLWVVSTHQFSFFLTKNTMLPSQANSVEELFIMSKFINKSPTQNDWSNLDV